MKAALSTVPGFVFSAERLVRTVVHLRFSTMASVQIVVFVVLSSLARKFQSEALVGDLVHPDARHHGHRSLVGASLITRLCCRRSLTAELPAGIDELVQRVSRFEHEDCVELLDSKTQARLDLE